MVNHRESIVSCGFESIHDVSNCVCGVQSNEGMRHDFTGVSGRTQGWGIPTFLKVFDLTKISTGNTHYTYIHWHIVWNCNTLIHLL